MKRIAINGMGRIGRASLKIISNHPALELVAVNDIAPLESIAYLIQYDSVHGTFEQKVEAVNHQLVVGGKPISFFSEANPEKLPWKALNIDIVVESTGIFTQEEDAQKHLMAGAKTVVLSGPAKSLNLPMVVHGINTKDGNTEIFSCASCTTNNVSPIIEVIGRRLGIHKAIMTTIHANTATNRTVDMSHTRDKRTGRSGFNNLIPTTTSAAKATTKVMPQYAGKFDGLAVRVPVAVGSLSDITMLTQRRTSVEEVNQILTEEATTQRYQRVFAVTNDPLVSSDIIKSPYAAIVDLEMTKVVDGDLLKVLAWYDNEWGFAHQMIRQIIEL